MTVDLHAHTTASDGTLTPAALVALAAERGLSAVAVTDHDSVEGLEEALAEGRRLGVLVIPGVELSTEAADGHDCHILGYFIDHTDAELASRLQELRAARMERAERMVAALKEAGYDIDLGHVLEKADGGSVGRAHLARALVERGHAENIGDAFRRLIGRDRPFYLRKPRVTPADAIALIKRVGGVAVIAHPGVSGCESSLDEMVAAGLAGIEAYHAEHSPEQREHFAEVARERGLFTTGGSDYHGPKSMNPGLGEAGVPESCLDALLAAAGRSR